MTLVDLAPVRLFVPDACIRLLVRNADTFYRAEAFPAGIQRFTTCQERLEPARESLHRGERAALIWLRDSRRSRGRTQVEG